MSKQLTLSGKNYIPKPYFKNPSSVYEQFVNKKRLEHSTGFGRKQDFLNFASSLYEKVKSSKDI